MLIGSRAAGAAHERSDWDLTFLADERERLDVGTLVSDRTPALGTDHVDVVDVATASAVLRRDAAVTGKLGGETRSGAYADFRIEAMRFWYDAEPVLREAFADVRRAMAI